jgi:hypothetical protein
MKNYNDIKLTGLIGSNSLGALAAFGLLKASRKISALAGMKLYWTMEHDWIAVMRTQEGIGRTELVENLINHMKAQTLDIFCWSDDVRVKPKDYRNKLDGYAKKATHYDRLDADYLTAFGSEIVSDGSKGLVKPTAFHMMSGQQKFLNAICKIANSLQSDSCQDDFEEALFGPWKYENKYHSFGWDSSAERLHAMRHISPTSESPRCVSAAVWLAIEALPLFPTAAIDGKLATTGFTMEKPTTLVWPIWTSPIGLDTLRTLLMTSDDESSLKKRGVAAIYRSVRSEFGQGYAILRPAIEI